jgi:hypothetical protein
LSWSDYVSLDSLHYEAPNRRSPYKIMPEAAAKHSNAVTIAHQIERDLQMEVHCLKSAKFALLGRPGLCGVPVPSLAGRFKMPAGAGPKRPRRDRDTSGRDSLLA